MSAASLPYTVLVLLVELAIGGLAMMTVFDARKQVTAGYVKAGALTVLPLAMLAAWTYLVIGRADEVQGYALASTWLRPFGIAFGAFLVIDCVHTIAAMREAHRLEVIAGTAGSVVGVAALVCLALWLGTPVWSTWGMFLSLLASAGVLGGSLMAMLWGHWYLTSGRLPKEPMEQMSLVLLVAIVVQIVSVALAQGARAVALSIVHPEDDPDLPTELRRLRRLLPAGIHILVGGRASAGYEAVLAEIGAIRVASLPQLAEVLDQMRRGPAVTT